MTFGAGFFGLGFGLHCTVMSSFGVIYGRDVVLAPTRRSGVVGIYGGRVGLHITTTNACIRANEVVMLRLPDLDTS